MFPINRYATAEICKMVSPMLQAFMWMCIDFLNIDVDYLQVFELSEEQELQKIVHKQEVPEYSKEYLIPCQKPLSAKIFVIDDGEYATMLFADEY